MAPPALHDLDGTILPAAAPSVLRALNAIGKRLEDFQRAPGRGDPADLRATARELLHALDLSTDVALACVLRNQIAGTYAMRHGIETAVVAALVGRRLHMRPAGLLSLVAAALALHATGRHGADDGAPPVAHALRCTHASEPDWFACLLLDHAQGEESTAEMTADTAAAAGDTAAADPASTHLLRMADRYCAGISPRNYRRALLPDGALARALELCPDPALAAAFAAEIGPWPPGTVVLLADGGTAVVAHRDGAGVEVLCLRDGAGHPFTVPQLRRTGDAGCAIAAALNDDDHELRIPMKQVWGPLASL